jgi:hypothetical protein
LRHAALPFPQYALLHSVTRVQLWLITILGNRGCVAVASFLDVPSPLEKYYHIKPEYNGEVPKKIRHILNQGFTVYKLAE